MPGAGTDRTKSWASETWGSETSATGCPVVILVEPQLAENIGTTARAMANFGLTRLRLVKPREPASHPRALAAASGAARILSEAKLVASLEDAIAGRTLVYGTTAREDDQAK